MEHRDSAGVHALVRPGELNLMTAGAGICHSEVSTAATTVLHGVQLWVALPDSDRDTGRDFAHYAPEPVSVSGAVLRVFLGELSGSRSPVHTFTPLLGAQVDLDPGARVALDVEPSFEHGVLLDQGRLEVAGTALDVADLAFQRAGRDVLTLHNLGDSPARAVLLGGPPFTEQLVMWWNFVGRSHDDIATYRRMWEDRDARFGAVEGYRGAVAAVARPSAPQCHTATTPQPEGNPIGMTKDKTGAPTTVTAGTDRYTIAVEGHEVGHTEFIRPRHSTGLHPHRGGQELRRTRPGNDSRRRGVAGNSRCRAANRRQLPDGGQLRGEARRVQGRRR